MGSERLVAGDMAEAERLFKRALEIQPDNFDARFALVEVKKVVAEDENFAVLVSQAALVRSGKLPMLHQKKISLHFALGKCFDDIKNYERAFMHFNEGCKLKRATIAYDPQQTTEYFADIMRIMDRPTIQRLCGGSDPSAVPIFVLGMPRSGTTLTEQIIASHPDVHGAGELPYMLAILQRDVNGEGAVYPYTIPKLQQADLAKWAEDYISALHRLAPDAQRITDKMPKNFIAIGLIHAMLPNAKIIHVNRSPVDTCLSCYTQQFTKQQEHTYDLAELGRYYSDYARLMEHWRKVLPAGAFLDVQYEDIVADLNKQARHIIAFCGLEWNDSCIDFYKNKRSIHTASVTQVRQPIYTSAVERWRNYEKFLDPLLDALGDLAPKRS